MDSASATAYIAESESRLVYPVHEEDAAARLVPYFTLRPTAGGDWGAWGHGHSGHDNEGRMPFMTEWLERAVLPLVDPAALQRAAGRAWRIELHDSYSYLPCRYAPPERYDNCLTFGRPEGARESAALIPDPYHICNFGGTTEVPDPVVWADKAPQLFFAGTTTGNRDPVRNTRIRACVWALDHPDTAAFKITNIAQMQPAEVLRAVPRLRECLAPYIPLSTHHQYRYQVNLVGNTACWSRVPMVMASGSVLFHLRHPDRMWYYPLLREGRHYLSAESFDDLLKLRDTCEADPVRCAAIVQDANAFVREHLRPQHAAAYMAQLLETAAWRGAP